MNSTIMNRYALNSSAITYVSLKEISIIIIVIIAVFSWT